MIRWVWLLAVLGGLVAGAQNAAPAQSTAALSPTPTHTDAVLAEIARQNAAAVTLREEISARVAQVLVRTQDLKGRLAETTRQQEADETRVKLSSSLGGPVSLVLLRHKAELGSARDSARDLARAQLESAEAELARQDLADRLAALRDPRFAAEKMLRDARGLSSASVEEVARALETQRRDFLEPLMTAERELGTALADREKAQAELSAKQVDYRRFIDAQVVWLPNDSPIGNSDASRAATEAGTLVSAAYWQDILAGVRSSMREFPLRWLLYAAIVAALLAYRGALLRRLRHLGESVGTPGDRFLNSIRALFITVLLALPIPAALYFGASLLQASSGGGEFVGGFANALDNITDVAFLCTLLMQISRPGGLAELHFRWPQSALGSLRRGTKLVANIAVPLLALSAVSWSVTAGPSALSRLSFIAALLVVGAVSAAMLKPSTGLFAAAIAKRPRGWVATLRGIWYPALVAIPFALALGAAAGYVFTTMIIFTNMVQTYWVIVGIALGLAMLDRLFQSTSERFAWRRGTTTAEQRRLGEQVGRVIRLTTFLLLLLGVVVAWSDVVPALNLMKSSTLWTVAGDLPTSPPKQVTVSDLLLFGVVMLLMVQLVRDLPGVLGLALLQRFPLDNSARYALVSLGRYVLVVAGIIAGFAALKIGWSNVQWLAAAMTVGLGFGLQEIFANFVSGLIMLTERPVRIGDVVTVDSVTGRVVKIATRATTLVDGDEKEVIIPNKQFITARIINWTLDDGPVRFMLSVGVDYGSDLRRAEELLKQALQDCANAVQDPPAGVALREFGESSVNFEVWYFVAHPRDNVTIRHSLILRIEELFRQNGLSLAFPQLDVHVRDVPGGTAGALVGGRSSS